MSQTGASILPCGYFVLDVLGKCQMGRVSLMGVPYGRHCFPPDEAFRPDEYEAVLDNFDWSNSTFKRVKNDS
jgi:hypothetical protein